VRFHLLFTPGSNYSRRSIHGSLNNKLERRFEPEETASQTQNPDKCEENK